MIDSQSAGSGSPLEQTPCRVLVLSESYLPWSGGSRVYYHNLYSRLACDARFRLRVFTTRAAGDHQFDSTAQTPKLSIVRAGQRLPSLHYRQWGAALRRVAGCMWQALTWRPNLIHCGDLFPQGIACMLLHWIARIPYLIFVHGDEISQTQHRRWQGRLRNEIYRHAAIVVAVNPYAKRRLDQLGGLSNLHLIVPGVDTQRFFPAQNVAQARTLLGFPDGLILLTVGRLCRRKGQLDLLEALPRIVQEFPSLVWVLAGEGPDRPLLQQRGAELGLEQHVRLLGDVRHSSVADLYRACDVFVMPSREEPNGDIESFGMVFLEAGACGKPSIGTRTGGIPDALIEGTTGLLAEPANPSSLVEQLCCLLRDSALRQRMGDAALSHARQSFSWQESTRTLAELSLQLATAPTTSLHLPAEQVSE